jgi:hypothetical protein
MFNGRRLREYDDITEIDQSALLRYLCHHGQRLRIFPISPANHIDTEASASLRCRRWSPIEDSSGQFAVELGAVVLAMETPYTRSTLIGAKWILHAPATTLSRICQPNPQPLLE